MNIKTIAIIISIIVLPLLACIATQSVKLSVAKAKNLELTADIAHLQTQLTLADAAIAKQNDTLDRFRLEAEANTATIANEYARLDKKYQLLTKKSADKLGNTPTCEDKLRNIYESQEAFCYER